MFLLWTRTAHSSVEPKSCNTNACLLAQAKTQLWDIKKDIKTPLERLYEKAPVMKEIAWCESRNRQFDENGNVLIGFSGADKGLFQINQVHWDKAREMGINLDTRQGNAKFAMHLYEKYGTQPWFMSEHCWNS